MYNEADTYSQTSGGYESTSTFRCKNEGASDAFGRK